MTCFLRPNSQESAAIIPYCVCFTSAYAEWENEWNKSRQFSGTLLLPWEGAAGRQEGLPFSSPDQKLLRISWCLHCSRTLNNADENEGLERKLTAVLWLHGKNEQGNPRVMSGCSMKKLLHHPAGLSCGWVVSFSMFQRSQHLLVSQDLELVKLCFYRTLLAPKLYWGEPCWICLSPELLAMTWW